MNKAQTKAAIKALGMRAKWSSEWQEWRVSFPDATKDEGYYTGDNQDALDTANAMLAHRYKQAANTA